MGLISIMALFDDAEGFICQRGTSWHIISGVGSQTLSQVGLDLCMTDMLLVTLGS